MRFSTTAILALAAPLLAWAQTNSSNSFIVPGGGISGTAGQSLTLTWTPTTSGTVSLILRSGASSDLNSGTPIASSIANSGSYTWSIPSDVTRGSDYTVEIVDDSNSSNVNFTPYFVIESTNTVASSTGADTSGAPSSTISQSTASATDGTTGVTASTTMSGSAMGSTTSSASSGSATGTHTSSGSMSTSASASRTSATASGAVITTSSAAAGSRATAMAGLLGMAALGAMAL